MRGKSGEFVNTDHRQLRMRLRMRSRHNHVFNDGPPGDFMAKAKDEGYSNDTSATLRYVDSEAGTNKTMQITQGAIQPGGRNTLGENADTWRTFLLDAAIELAKKRRREGQTTS